MKARVTANGVSVYEKNTMMSKCIGHVNIGDTLDIEAEYGKWVKLTSGGWVRAEYTEPTDLSGGGTGGSGGGEAALPYVIVTFQGDGDTEIDREASVFPTFATLMEYFNNRRVPNIPFVYSDDYGHTDLDRSTRLSHCTQFSDQTCNAMMLGTTSYSLYVTDEDEVLTESGMNEKYPYSGE